MHSNVRNDDTTQNFNISSIAPPATSDCLEDISTASLNFSEENIEQQNGSTGKIQEAGKSDVVVVENAGSFKTHVTTQSETCVNGMANASGMHISAENRPADHRNQDTGIAGPLQTSAVIVGTSIFTESFEAQATGLSDMASTSVPSSDALDLSANTQELMELVYKNVCEEKEN